MTPPNFMAIGLQIGKLHGEGGRGQNPPRSQEEFGPQSNSIEFNNCLI